MCTSVVSRQMICCSSEKYNKPLAGGILEARTSIYDAESFLEVGVTTIKVAAGGLECGNFEGWIRVFEIMEIDVEFAGARLKRCFLMKFSGLEGAR